MMNRDIVEEILLRLPPKSLERSKSLSKEWYNFISYNASFRQKYLSRDSGRNSLLLGLFFCEAHQSQATEPVRFLHTSTKGNSLTATGSRLPLPIDESLGFLGQNSIHVLGSSNGLLLCGLGYLGDGNYIICNPITREWVALPPPNCECLLLNHGFLGHATYQKVVRVIPNELPDIFTNALIVEFFSSENPHGWQELDLILPFQVLMLDAPIIITKQDVIYIPVILMRQTNGLIILELDLTKGIYYIQILRFPAQPNPGREFWCGCLGQSDGQILYAHSEYCQLRIWVLTEFRRDSGRPAWKWCLKHRSGLPMMVGKRLYAGQFRLISFHPMNPNVLFCVTVEDKFFSFEAGNINPELVCDIGEQGLKSGYVYFPYSYGLIGPHLFCDI